jgi:hypothetical protein
MGFSIVLRVKLIRGGNVGVILLTTLIGNGEFLSTQIRGEEADA